MAFRCKMTNGCTKTYSDDSLVKTPDGDKPLSYLIPGAEVSAYDGSVLVIETVEEVML